ncbi:lytic transglycosylase domain-containing protein [Glaciihabitans arcticus]|uniref:lytic transglycosylase domain-containing protein n=1 Tax=Glaciihabitans arcticus TaxID=2668039 RepID=UPI001386C7EC|nr:lytic transglycosylase domain-containing protein [Glaciihabitans arcticus]
MPSRRIAIIAAAIIGGLAVLVAGVWVLLAPIERLSHPSEPVEANVPTWSQQAALPPLWDDRTPGNIGLLTDPVWLDSLSAETGIPERALTAYAGSAIAKNEFTSGCGIGWNTLAAIGYVESRHGTHGGSIIDEDGVTTPPIYGVILDGGDTANIPDTDGGAFDGLDDIDRAVGPMQFIPQAAANWLGDANADGVADAQNIDDAALAAAHYLCRAGGDLRTEEGWKRAIAAYNSAPSYLIKVAAKANEYLDAARANDEG